MRWADGVKGVRREREPVWVVRRIEGLEGGGWWDGGEGADEGGEGRRVMVVG